ncbi:MAG: outer membrane lipoprotein carrier protein LolA [Deltaproteobacteria bacterium]|nr:outer membrane lipoprotein carrier protein LolA [Deltaproteobacteria bacterium]MBN2670834.1 outer membrane lipoprotein carrier protein LolA [Deltaproteobacteria bacterium]
MRFGYRDNHKQRKVTREQNASVGMPCRMRVLYKRVLLFGWVLAVLGVDAASQGVADAAEKPETDTDPEPFGAFEPSKGEGWLTRSAACYDKKGGFTARFTHENISRLGARSEALTGTISVSATGLLAMAYEAPDEKQIVFDGKKIRAYDKKNQIVVERFPNADLLFSSFIQLVGPKVSALETQYLVRELAPIDSNGLSVLSLTPKFDTSLVKQIVVTVGECPVIRRIIVLDRAGNMVRLTFSDITLVGGFAKKTFRLTPPDNVIVVRP